MPGEWITGEKIMQEHGIAANDLGQACRKGELQAWLPEGVQRIYDLSTVCRIPKYPPPDIDPFQHIKQGETVEWDWGYDYSLNHEAIDVAKTVLVALDGAYTHNTLIEATRHYMTIGYHVKVDDKFSEEVGIPSKTFFFDIHMYSRGYCKKNKLYHYVPIEEIIPHYKEELSKMWFKEKEFMAWLNTRTNHIQLEYTSDNSIASTEYMKPLAWLQKRWGNTQIEDVAVALWKYGITPWRISSTSTLTGFSPVSFHTMGNLTGDDLEEKKQIFHVDQRQIEKLETEQPGFLQITEEDRQKYHTEIVPRPEPQCRDKDAMIADSHPTVPASVTPTLTGSVKNSIRHEQTLQACETVREEIGQGKHGFLVNDEYKTNNDYFGRAVQSILGDIKPRRDTVREEWGKVPKDIKHTGRVPDQ